MVDRSTKGSIDEPALPFLRLFNAHPDWITTSTCSGRLVTYLPGPAMATGTSKVVSVNGKGGGDWLFVTHSTLSSSQLSSPISTLFGGRVVDTTHCVRSDPTDRIIQMTYQPPVIHLMARSVSIAASILRAAIGAGFRNSGITVGQGGRVILAIRSSTGGLDVPIARLAKETNDEKIELLVTEDYLSDLLVMGNHLMEKNQSRLSRLLAAFELALKETKPNVRWETSDERRRRMKAEGLALQSKNKSVETDETTIEDGAILDDIQLLDDL
ncbi:methyltransferase TYW3-domain-containing protein [Melampsora americana]|nr:methyltransferase TYW3-domain-containing protein [Melampsora americana]